MAFLMPIISLVVSIASTVYSAISESNTQRFNQKVANQQAKYASQRAEFEAKQHAIKMRQLLGQQRVGYASAGVSLMSGSAQDVTGDTLEQGAIDAMVIRYGGRVEADRYSAQASQFGEAANSAVVGGIARAGTTLLSAYGGANAGGGSVGYSGSSGNTAPAGGGYTMNMP